MKMWGKIYIDNKIVKHHVINIENDYLTNLTMYLAEVCNELDIATPVVLNKHLDDLENYNNVIFLESDFVEQVSFDKFVVEIF